MITYRTYEQLTQFEIMSLQSPWEYYHEVCHNYLSYSAISAIVCGKGLVVLDDPFSIVQVKKGWESFVFMKIKNSQISFKIIRYNGQRY